MAAARKTDKFNSAKALNPLWMALRLMGIHPPDKYKPLYYLYSVVLNVIVTFCYPLSIFIYVFYAENKRILFSNLSQFTGCLIVSLKVLNTYFKRDKLLGLRELMAKVDSRVSGDDEKKYFEYIFKVGHRFFMTFAMSCGFAGAVCDLPVIFPNGKLLIFPAWLPWDWRSSKVSFHAANAYQVLGLYVQIYQDVITDTYPAIMFWVLKGHLKVLGMRIKKIGWDSKKQLGQNYQELVQCIKDHQACFKYFKLCQDISSQIMLMQFICTQVILCVTALYIIFYNEDRYKSAYLVSYFACMIMEISFCCYCGSELIAESNAFTEALFSCNWMDQSERFKKVLIISLQNTQSPWIIYAGGIISVSLSTWLTVLKSAYSLFAVFGRTL